jgi:NAD(P)-dependent dehydrogenase (short-subunit alcohol dehydrogenase family)
MGSGSSSFSVNQIQDLTGKVALVTGGNSGIGFSTVKILLAKGATVIIAGRSMDKVNEALTKLDGLKLKGRVSGMKLDIAAFSSIDKFVVDFKRFY